MSNVSKGEWRVVHEPFCVSVESEHETLFERYLSDVDDQDARDELWEALANATLIHAAPDLLKALQDMVDAYEHEASSENPALVGAREAILKSTTIQ